MSRELDKAIAEALGWKRHEGLWQDPKKELEISWPDYSSDGREMIALDSYMCEKGWNKTTDIDFYGHVVVNYWNDDNVYQTAGYKSQPYLSAVTAYKALTGKEWEVQGE